MLRNLTVNVPCVGLPLPAEVALAASDTRRLPAAASTPDSFLVHPVHPVLYPDMWGVVGGFGSRADLLNLRSASREIGKGVDRSIKSLTVNADQGPAMLAILGHARDLKHINTICITHCTNENFPPLLVALTALPHAKVHLRMEREGRAETILDARTLPLLRDIAPASLHLVSEGLFTDDEVRLLGQLTYPLAIKASAYRSQDNMDLSLIAALKTLVSLNLRVNDFSERAAQAFKDHSVLRELRLQERGWSWAAGWGMTITDTAITALAGNAALRTLEIGPTQKPMGDKALKAIVANTTLERLTVGTLHEPFNESAAIILSKNAALKHVQIALSDGYVHLCRMPALRSLVVDDVRAQISLDDAHQIAAVTHLKRLAVKSATLAPGALAVLATSRVEMLTLHCLTLDDQTVAAVLSNFSLRRLHVVLLRPFEFAVRQATALASHPTLTSLSISHGSPAYRRLPALYAMTDVERADLHATWGPDRPAAALDVDL